MVLTLCVAVTHTMTLAVYRLYFQSSYIRQNCLHMSASLDDHLFVQDDWSLPCGPPCGEEGHAATPLIQRSFQGESYDRQSPLDSGIAESSLGATAFVSASQYFQDSQDFHDYSHESSAVLPHHPLTAHAPTPFSISLHQPFVEYGGRPQDGCRAADSNDGETCSHYGTVSECGIFDPRRYLSPLFYGTFIR